MAGIEQAFKDFVKRVSEKENQEQVSGERGFQYGGGAIGYADGGRINYAGGGSGLPPVEEDQSEQLFGQNIQTPPTGFNFAVNRPMPVYQEGQPEISGGIRDLRNYVNTNMGNVNPQLNYVGDNFGGNVSAMMNPFTNMPKSYSADAYYGPEQGRFNLGFTTVPTADARQLRAGYEGPYGNISLGASRDPSGNNYMLNYSNSFADGGRAGYADGNKPTREDSPILQINPMEKDIQFSQDPTMEQMPNVGIGAIGLTKKAKDYNRYIKAFESNDPKVFKKWFDSQTKEFSKTKKLAEDAEMFELIPEVARGASKTEKQLANNQLRESMGGYYAQELGPYYSQEIGILDNLIFKKNGGHISQGEPVDTDLTRTIPPDSGPNPQGVETLFKRRYN